MLVEVVLCPELFSGDDDILRERLHQLANILFPRRQVPIVVVCQLGNGSWQLAVAKRIAAIQNRNLQSDAMKLIVRIIDSACVVRRTQQDSIPETESQWIAMAIHCTKQAPVDAIVVASGESGHQCVMSFAEFERDEFWVELGNPRFVPRCTQAQVKALRTLAFHADWMIVRLPQLRGSCDDEIVTINQILELVAKRGKPQPRCSIELHVCQRANTPDQRLLKNIESELKFNPTIVDVTVKLLPQNSFVDRELLAGQWAPMPGGGRKRRARWLLTMSHVAVGSNRENISTPSTWALFGPKQAQEHLAKLNSELDLLQGGISG